MSIESRPTKEVNIQDVVFVIKEYATAREAFAIEQAMFKGTKVKIVGKQSEIADFNTGAQFEVEKQLVAQLVVSVDGHTDDVVNRCIDLPQKVSIELLQMLDGMLEKKSKTEDQSTQEQSPNQ